MFVCTCILGKHLVANVLSSRFMVFLLPKRNFNDRHYKKFKILLMYKTMVRLGQLCNAKL